MENLDCAEHTALLMLEADRLLTDADGQQIAAFDTFLKGCENEGISFMKGLELAVKELRTSEHVPQSLACSQHEHSQESAGAYRQATQEADPLHSQPTSPYLLDSSTWQLQIVLLPSRNVSTSAK